MSDPSKIASKMCRHLSGLGWIDSATALSLTIASLVSAFEADQETSEGGIDAIAGDAKEMLRGIVQVDRVLN